MKSKLLTILGLGLILCSCASSYDESDKYSVGKPNLKNETINKIDVNWIGGEISVTPTTNSTINVYEEIDSTATDEQKMHYYLDKERTLNIQYAASNIRKEIEGLKSKKLYIEIPTNLKLDELDIESVSAKTTVSTLNTFSKVDIKTESSDIKVTGTKATELDIESVSGSIVVQNVKVTDLDCTTVSSSIKGQYIVATDLDIETESGEVDFQIDSGLSEAKIDSESGDITLNLKEKIGYTLDYVTKSGKFTSNVETTTVNNRIVVGSGIIKISVETKSADLTINK